MDQRAILDRLGTMIGQPIGLSDWFLVDQKRINQFAECTGDNQWIHTDIERAAQGPFGKTIAHGFLTLALIPAMSESISLFFDYSQVEMSINYGLNKVRFIKAVPVDSRVRSRVILANAEEKPPGRILVTYQHSIEIEGQDEPACVAETLGLILLK